MMNLCLLVEEEGDCYALLVLVVGIHFLLKVLPASLGVGVKALYVLVRLELVVRVLSALLKVWVAEHVMKRT